MQSQKKIAVLRSNKWESNKQNETNPELDMLTRPKSLMIYGTMYYHFEKVVCALWALITN